jgi:cellulose synthase/poly-beta-1,6-N-acetylglucosamine synthase-like glycosyltransferase
MASQQIMLPTVSITVCTYKSKDTIKACLESLQRLRYPDYRYEIIVVDSTPNNSVKTIVDNYRARYFCTEPQGYAAARNFGISKAKGEIVAFLDSDCVADTNWLGDLVKGFSNGEVAGVGGIVMSGRSSSFNLFSNHQIDKAGYLIFDQKAVSFLADPLRVPHLQSANCAFRKYILERLGGFTWQPRGVGGEDIEISLRLLRNGYKLRFVSAIVYHKIDMTIKRMGRGFRDGRSTYFLLKLNELSELKRVVLKQIQRTLSHPGEILVLAGFLYEAIRETVFPLRANGY